MAMRRRWFLLAGGMAFVFFWLHGGHGHLFQGHDHFCSGHLMLLAQSYRHAHFATPLGVPVEDPFGPVGAWVPYTGWPPLFALGLAAFQECAGDSLAAARVAACAFSAVAAALVFWLSWRVTRDRLAALVGLLLFVGHFAIIQYCSFVCNETAALPWSLLLIGLFPALVVSGSPRGLTAYAVLAAVGGLLSWHCYVAPLACVVALFLTDRSQFQARWRQVLTPVAVLAVTGLALVLVFRQADSVKDVGRKVGFRFLERTGLLDPVLAIRYATTHVVDLAKQSTLPAACVLLIVAIHYALRRRAAASPVAAPVPADPAREAEFFTLALGLFPALWLVLMPNMHEHDFQKIFTVPFLAVLGALLVQRTRPVLAGLGAKRVHAMALGAVFLALVGVEAVWVWPLRADCPVFAQLEKDVQALTNPETVMVMELGDRGAWWRMQRPVLDFEMAARVAGRRHVRLVRSDTVGWEESYTMLQARTGFGEPLDGYLILAPRDQSAHAER
jgi:hypothetical protein